ncbi:Glutathione-regulated potassium-efflux system protein KefC [Stieleria maiorica]|uniref:Glutathione-regulated potassium-efflux system protein KefC n=1 Tax=Stieleria maiorica TaxID=2795974 RepID=A0A5B9M9I2_9BACT|nr:NAD-binding protein [Stieleria maiorica]QEF97931.1 Glutathione-regulated potassium-efflux system protein KefC [Stieleria maiorica]
MKSFTTLYLHFMRNRASRRNLRVLTQFALLMFGMIAIYSVIFHHLMAWEGRRFSWITGIYWTLTVMSTLGFGDITFHTDLGRLFSMVVLMSGTLFMLILLPFTFIQFFYAPWMQAQEAARAPRQLPANTEGHVIVTDYGPVEAALIKRLTQFKYPYVILVSDVAEALRLHDLDLKVVVGELDDPETYRLLRTETAALVATIGTDVINTNVAFTAREVSETVPIVATAANVASVDILELAGCTRVLELAEMMGRSLARRVIGRDAKTHVIGQFDDLLIAEASAARTPLVGRTLRDIRLRDHVNLSVSGVWERGRYQNAGPDTLITENTILVMAGTREQLDEYDSLFCIYHFSNVPIVIIGFGRVGSATARGLEQQGIDFRVVEKDERRKHDDRVIVGDAADLEILKQAGIMETSAVVITTHDDALNVYLTLYCRRLHADVQIISRATHERNIHTLHRAGADFVISESSMGANVIFNLLRRSDVLLLAEGLDVFKVHVPSSLAGKTLVENAVRQRTGCSVIAIQGDEGLLVNPDPDTKLPANAEMFVIGTEESQQRFLDLHLD